VDMLTNIKLIFYRLIHSMMMAIYFSRNM